MPNFVTIARPYAKAIFEYALSNKQLSQWSDLLAYLSGLVSSEKVAQFITNPDSKPDQQAEFLLADTETLAGDAGNALNNFVKILADKKRLLALPEIKAIYEALRAEEEKSIQVEVISFSPLSDAQEARLAEKLRKRLNRQVSLSVTLDPLLLGGAVIKAGDLVIDGSVSGQLNKLRANLAA